MRIVTKQEDNAKVVMLGGGVVVAFGFVVWRVISALGGQAPAPSSGDPTIGTSGPQVVVPSTAPVAAASPNEADIVIPTFAPGTTPNPFHRDVDDFRLANIKVNSDPNRPNGRKKTNGSGNGGKEIFHDAPLVPQLDPEPMEVKGIMGSVAVIQIGDKQFVVDNGSQFGKGLRLVSVSPTKIVIQEGKTIHNLKVGVRTFVPQSAAPKPTLPKLSGTIPANSKDSGLLTPQ